MFTGMLKILNMKLWEKNNDLNINIKYNIHLDSNWSSIY